MSAMWYRIKNCFFNKLVGCTPDVLELYQHELLTARSQRDEAREEAQFWKTRSMCHQVKIKELEAMVEDLKDRKEPLLSFANMNKYLIGRYGCLVSLHRANSETK